MTISPAKLSHIRKSKNISQEDVAKAIGLKKQNISLWECGTKAVPVKYHQKLCNILGVAIEELYENIYNAPVNQGKKQIPPYKVSSIPIVSPDMALLFDNTLESFDHFLTHHSKGQAPIIGAMIVDGMAAIQTDISISDDYYPDETILYFNYLEKPRNGARVIAKLREKQKIIIRLFTQDKNIIVIKFIKNGEKDFSFSGPAENPFEWIFPVKYSLRDEAALDRSLNSPKDKIGWIF